MHSVYTPHQYLKLVSAIAIALIGVVLMTILIRPVHAQGAGEGNGSKRIITVHDDGVDKGFVTEASSVREALKDGGIRLDARDRTEPGLDEKLVANSYQINVYHARPVLIRDGTSELTIITAYRTGEQIAKDAHIILHDEDKLVLSPSTDPIADGAAEVMTITRAIPFTFVFYGKTEQTYTQAKTIGEMLKQKGITLAQSDRTSEPLSTPITAGMTVRLWREGVQTVTVEEEVKFTTKKVQDADQPVGYKRIETEGKSGRRTVTYEITTQNGVETARKEINSVTTSEPVEEVVIVGGKSAYGESLQQWLFALRTCETGNNYSRNSGNGYYGAYQFLPSTWDNIARKTGRLDLVGVLPSLASPADQDAMVIANTNMTAGLVTQHPGCYAKLGISNKPPTE